MVRIQNRQAWWGAKDIISTVYPTDGKIDKMSKDVDFKKMFGKYIYEFFEDSEWDIELIGRIS